MKRILLALLTIVSLKASAGFHIEPILGYRLADGDIGSTSYDFTGPYMGARLGYALPVVYGGLDFKMGTTEIEFDTSGTKTKHDYKTQDLGVFVGTNIIPLFNVWAKYVFSSKLEDDDGSDKGEVSKGSGTGLGVGFTGLPFVQLNIEYTMFEYDKFEDSPTAPTSGTLSPKWKHNEIAFSVSLPLDL